jgi:quinol-cytochrome oxidoreductase complex cytochrome b subunit
MKTYSTLYLKLLHKKSALLSLVFNHSVYYPTASNLNYFWSFGSLAGLFFALQLLTGIILAMHYTPHIDLAFLSVEHIMFDVKSGYIFRYFHSNGASMVFIMMYLHIARNLYYQSYLSQPAVWVSGVVIFLLMMGTAFIGYVLPWGQMSFWGATVITSLVTAVPEVGSAIAGWIWGGFAISNATLNRFFSLHYLLPFAVLGVVGLHLIFLHVRGSTNPLWTALSEKIGFFPYFVIKDAFVFVIAFGFFNVLVFYYSNLLGHSDNFIPANPLVTPAHIVPEWYFTPFYAVLRACPDKLGGVISMLAAILILLILPLVKSAEAVIGAGYSRVYTIKFWLFLSTFFLLMVLGMRAAAEPYVGASQVFTLAYFSFFIQFVLFVLTKRNTRSYTN